MIIGGKYREIRLCRKRTGKKSPELRLEYPDGF